MSDPDVNWRSANRSVKPALSRPELEGRILVNNTLIEAAPIQRLLLLRPHRSAISPTRMRVLRFHPCDGA